MSHIIPNKIDQDRPGCLKIVLIGLSVPAGLFAIFCIIMFIITEITEPLLNKVITKREYEKVKELLESGENPNEGGNYKPIHLAAQNGHFETVKILIDYGADVKSLTYAKVTPLHFAASSGNLEIVKLLISKGAQADAKDKEGRTALSWVWRRQRIPQEIKEYLELYEQAHWIRKQVKNDEEYITIIDYLRTLPSHRDTLRKKMTDSEYDTFMTKLKQLKV